MTCILLAVDGSDHARRAAEMAGTLSKALEMSVDVVHIVPEAAMAHSAEIAEYARIEKVTITHRELLQSAGADVVTSAAAIVLDSGGQVGKTEVLLGKPAEEIVRYAEDHDARYIVMGRRGLGEVKGLFMGSVSHNVGHLTDRTLITTE